MTDDLKKIFHEIHEVQGDDESVDDKQLDFPGFLLIMKRLQDEDFAGINEKVAERMDKS